MSTYRLYSVVAFLLCCLCAHSQEIPQITTFDLADFSAYTLPKRQFFYSLSHNEDAKLNFTQLVTKYGYQAKNYTATTEDGYILTLFRILKSKKCAGDLKRRPVLLQHGLIDSSVTFIIAGPTVGMAYLLSDACYDVWIGNHRGNSYSRKHVTLNPDKDPHYWNFTFDQHGMYDLPAMVDLVLKETESPDLNYIGHSQGTTDLFVLCSTRPEYNIKFKLALCLAPVAWCSHMFSPLLQIVSKLTPKIKAGLDIAGQRELFGINSAPNKLLEFVCHFIPEVLCGTGMYLLTGSNPDRLLAETVSAMYGHFPAATSADNFAHFGQALNVDKFMRYDYGSKKENLAVYGTETPPEFDMSKVTAPVLLYYGSSDWLVSVKDVATLKSKLPNVVESYLMPDKDWSHHDFVSGNHLPDQLMPKIYEHLVVYG